MRSHLSFRDNNTVRDGLKLPTDCPVLFKNWAHFWLKMKCLIEGLHDSWKQSLLWTRFSASFGPLNSTLPKSVCAQKVL